MEGKEVGARGLTGSSVPANIHGMALSFLIFNFGGDEEGSQQARHRIEGWKQGFRLDKKLQLKFDREKSTFSEDASPPSGKRTSKVKTKAPGAGADRDSGSNVDDGTQILMIVRLDFSDHEKLSYRRWVERIPTEEPFKTAKPRTILPGDPEFTKTSEWFDSLV